MTTRRAAAGSLGEALQQALQRLGYDGPIRRRRALEVWEEAVGETLAAHSRATGWQGDTLLVEVDDAVWAQQLALLKHRLVRAVNARLDQPAVADLRFVVRGRPLRQARTRHVDVPPAGRSHADSGPEAASVPGDLVRRYRHWLEAADACGDPDLAAAMGRWLLRQLARHLPPAGDGEDPTCPSCGAPAATREPCPACTAEWRPGGIRQQVMACLSEEPWLGEEELRRRIPACDARIYAEVRGKLLLQWKSELLEAHERLTRRRLRPAGAEALRRRAAMTAARYACLVTGREPARLTDEDVLRAVGPAAAELLGPGGR